MASRPIATIDHPSALWVQTCDMLQNGGHSVGRKPCSGIPLLCGVMIAAVGVPTHAVISKRPIFRFIELERTTSLFSEAQGRKKAVGWMVGCTVIAAVHWIFGGLTVYVARRCSKCHQIPFHAFCVLKIHRTVCNMTSYFDG